MASTERRYSKEEFARRGDALYEKQVRPQLKVVDEGKFAAIDIETGEFAIDGDELKAGNKLLKRIPDAQIWMVRVGFAHGPPDWRSTTTRNTMITGVVKSDEGRIRFKVRGLRGREQEVEVVIDTGYTASLTLPPAIITALGLRWRSMERFTLADGSDCVFDVYVAKVVWDGRVRQILVTEADAEPLVGMRLLKGHELKMQIRYRGKVTIIRLPRK